MKKKISKTAINLGFLFEGLAFWFSGFFAQKGSYYSATVFLALALILAGIVGKQIKRFGVQESNK